MQGEQRGWTEIGGGKTEERTEGERAGDTEKSMGKGSGERE